MVRPYVALALEQMRLGNPRGAIPHLKAALAAEPDNALAHAYAALCLIETGYSEGAARMAFTAVRLAPELAYAHLVAGVVALSRLDYETARKHLDESRRLDPTEPDLYRWLAELYDRTGRRKDILPILEEGLTHDPHDVRLLVRLGRRYVDLGRHDDAARLAGEALALDPENDAAHVLQGHLCFTRGDKSGAWEHAMAALCRDATDPATLRLVCTLKASGNPVALWWWRLSLWIERLGHAAPLNAVMLGVLIVYLILARMLVSIGLMPIALVIGIPVAIFLVAVLYGARRIKKILDQEASEVKLRRDF